VFQRAGKFTSWEMKSTLKNKACINKRENDVIFDLNSAMKIRLPCFFSVFFLGKNKTKCNFGSEHNLKETQDFRIFKGNIY
jgi:hypothetical protein